MFECAFSSPLNILVTEMQGAMVLHGRDPKRKSRRPG